MLQRTIRDKVAFWKQRGKIRTAIEADENTRFFHASASNRLRRNKISILEINGVEISNHQQKTDVPTSYFKFLLGVTPSPSWNFDLSLIYPDPIPALQHIDYPFTEKEILDAFLGMNASASPGPDGFGPGFYRKFWHVVKPQILKLFSDFHSQSIDTAPFNRAHIVLLPKSESARSPDAFRPISLQNCTIKAIAKVLTNRLKPLIPLLVSKDQTGFMSGRSITENFVYAADLLNCCFKRKCPTLVIKLDFRKAFDSVN